MEPRPLPPSMCGDAFKGRNRDCDPVATVHATTWYAQVLSCPSSSERTKTDCYRLARIVGFVCASTPRLVTPTLPVTPSRLDQDLSSYAHKFPWPPSQPVQDSYGSNPRADGRSRTRLRSRQVQRDVRDLSRVRGLEALPRLLALTAAQTARLINVSDPAAHFRLSRPTINDYVTLLERVFLLERLPRRHSNRLSRLVKTPKLHIGDTGLACALLGVGAVALAGDRPSLGQLLETFVFQELRRQASWHDAPSEFFHYHDKDKVEVDIVIEGTPLARVGDLSRTAAASNPSKRTIVVQYELPSAGAARREADAVTAGIEPTCDILVEHYSRFSTLHRIDRYALAEACALGCQSVSVSTPDRRAKSTPSERHGRGWPTGPTGLRGRTAPDYKRFLKRRLSLPVSIISQ